MIASMKTAGCTRSRGPFTRPALLHDLVGDPADRVLAHVRAGRHEQVCRDLPGGQALGAYKLMTRVSKSVIPTLPLGHDHRLETAVPIPRNGNLHLAAIVGDHSRGPVPVCANWLRSGPPDRACRSPGGRPTPPPGRTRSPFLVGCLSRPSGPVRSQGAAHGRAPGAAEGLEAILAAARVRLNAMAASLDSPHNGTSRLTLRHWVQETLPHL